MKLIKKIFLTIFVLVILIGLVMLLGWLVDNNPIGNWVFGIIISGIFLWYIVWVCYQIADSIFDFDND